MSKRLFDLSAEILTLEAALDNEELTDDQRQALVDQWLEAQGDVTTKLDNYAAWLEELKTSAEQRKFQATRMKLLAQADENRVEYHKTRLKLYFQRHQLTKFKTPRFTLALQAAGGKRALIVPPEWAQDAALAPEQFRKVRIEIDTDALRAVVEKFYAEAEAVTAEATDDQERRRLFKEWIESDQEARITKELIEGCELAERTTSIRIR